MIGWATGEERDGVCETCGAAVREREMGMSNGTAFFSPTKHVAPCGRPCVGGGVRLEESTYDVLGRVLRVGSGIAFAHRNDGCGADGCNGGVNTNAAKGVNPP